MMECKPGYLPLQSNVHVLEPKKSSRKIRHWNCREPSDGFDCFLAETFSVLLLILCEFSFIATHQLLEVEPNWLADIFKLTLNETL